MVAIAALASAVSCNKAPEASGDEGFVTVTYTVTTGVATKASFGGGTLATDLTVQVFRKDAGSGTVTWTPTSPVITKTKQGTSPESWKVTMKLAKSYDYRVGFWAQSTSVPAGAFNIADLRAVAVDYTKFTIVIWIEGNDDDTTDDIIGGQFKVDMKINIIGDEEGTPIEFENP